MAIESVINREIIKYTQEEFLMVETKKQAGRAPNVILIAVIFFLSWFSLQQEQAF